MNIKTVSKAACGLLFLLLLVACKKDNNQNPAPSWPKAYYAYSPGIHKAADILALPNNQGYLILGSYQSYTSTDVSFYLVKTDTAGAVVWQHIYGAAGYENIPKRVKLLSNGNYLLIGDRIGVQSEMQLMTISSGGTLISSGVIPAASGENASISDAVEDSNGDFFVVGKSNLVAAKPETAQYGTYDLTDVVYMKVDAALNILAKATRGYIGSDKGGACFSINNQNYMTYEPNSRTGGTPSNPTFQSNVGVTGIRVDNLQEVWYQDEIYTSNVNIVGAAIDLTATIPIITSLGQSGQNILTNAVATDGMQVATLNSNTTGFSGSVEVKSIERMPNGQFLIATVLTNGSDRNVHTMILNASYQLVAEYSTGLASEQESVARAIPAGAYNVFVADITNAYTQAPSQFINVPDSIVLGIAQ